MRWNRTITVVGTHAGGDVVNVVTGGVFDVPGETMFDKRRHLQRHADGLRKFLTLRAGGDRSSPAPTSCCLRTTPRLTSATLSWNRLSTRRSPDRAPSASRR